MKKSSFGASLLAISTTALALSGCNKAEGPSPAGAASVAAPAMDASIAPGEVREVSASKEASAPNAETKPAQPAPANVTQLLLAYSYTTAFTLPNSAVLKVKQVHEAKCVAAGPALCQIVDSSSDSVDGATFANLSIRATSGWLESFRGGFEKDAKDVDGKIGAQTVVSEDLTRSITDSESRLRALKTLRTRLEALIASRPGKLSDLLEVERELARVQGDIDSFESNVAVMRGRVSMSSLKLSYSSRPPAVEAGAFSPLLNALRGFFGVMSISLASLINIFAAVLPFALVLVPSGYFVLKWKRERARKEAQEREES